MARKLLEKAGLVQLPGDARRPGEAAAADEAGRAKTAPGSMLHFMTSQSTAVREVEALRGRLAEFDEALPVRRIDARRIRASSWANRHAASFEDAAYAALKHEIASAGGNVQPIKVRPLSARSAGGVGPSNPPGRQDAAGDGPTPRPGRGVGPSNPLDRADAPGGMQTPPRAAGGVGPSDLPGAGDGPGHDYEIVFGHRRHRACLDLGLPVLALVEDVSERDLFVAMERENRGRRDLSAWEQGRMYARALDQGLYASNRQLAAAIGRDLGDVGKALSLARLPAAVIDAFGSPLDLQYRWAKPLAQAQQRDPEGLLARARAVRPLGERLSSKQVLDILLGTAQDAAAAPSADAGAAAAGAAAFSIDGQGRTVITIDRRLDEDRRRALAALIDGFLGTA